MAGAGIAAAAYLAASDESEAERRVRVQREQHHQHPPTKTDQEKEDKVDGVVKVCEICFVDFEDLKNQGIQIMATPCGHVFCRVCIEESLTRRPSCPNCRSHCEINQLQRLFL